jgi:hypothetical protein
VINAQFCSAFIASAMTFVLLVTNGCSGNGARNNDRNLAIGRIGEVIATSHLSDRGGVLVIIGNDTADYVFIRVDSLRVILRDHMSVVVETLRLPMMPSPWEDESALDSNMFCLVVQPHSDIQIDMPMQVNRESIGEVQVEFNLLHSKSEGDFLPKSTTTLTTSVPPRQ